MLHREGSSLASCERIASDEPTTTVAGPNRSTGSASATAVTTDCHSQRDAPETSPFRQARPLLVDGLDPLWVTKLARTTRGNRDPRRALPLARFASAPVLFRLGRRAASVGQTVTVRCPRSTARGSIQRQRGPGLRRSKAFAESSSSDNALSSRSPSSPQFGTQLPSPVRWLTGSRGVHGRSSPGRL